MKTMIAVVAAVAALSGCASQQPAYYVSSARVVQDPYQWHTVSVMPSDRAYGGAAPATTYTSSELPPPSNRVVYTSEPVYTTSYVQSAPVIYAPTPVYYAPPPLYYGTPVSIGLDFSFGRWCCGGNRHGYGHGYGRGWSGRGGYHRR